MLSLIERGKNPMRKVLRLALKETDRQLSRKGTASEPEGPRCPTCNAKMRLRRDYLNHWYYGRLKDHATCGGQAGARHRVVSLGILPRGNDWTRLDRAINPQVAKEVVVPTAVKRTKTAYEKRYGWVWCPGCGQILKPYGTYAYHARGGRLGPVYQIFRCWNKDNCPKYAVRFKCRGGRIFEHLPSRGRKTALPAKAQQCPKCAGPTNRKAGEGVPAGQVRVVCKVCGSIHEKSLQEKPIETSLASSAQTAPWFGNLRGPR